MTVTNVLSSIKILPKIKPNILEQRYQLQNKNIKHNHFGPTFCLAGLAAIQYQGNCQTVFQNWINTIFMLDRSSTQARNAFAIVWLSGILMSFDIVL